jgi:hypothetical protein
MRIRTCVAVLSAAFVTTAAPAAAQDPIQPGDYMESGGSACTLNFAYDGTGAQAGKTFMGTAAHCVTKVGDDVALEDGTVFGDVALIGDETAAAPDYAFIEVRPAFVSRVSPALKGHPTLPRGGYTRSAETKTGDLIQQSGYGIGANFINVTREQRRSALVYDDAEEHGIAGYSIFGDSGGPYVHLPTGKAFGIVSRACIDICQEQGPTVEGLLAKAAARGFTVTLRTVS